ncbi:MAG TPA: DciA family protein [Methylophilaceae bacterium]|nr:DciA family protein [Methylophilaceae bacterium]
MRRINALFRNDAALMALHDHADSLSAMQATWSAVCPDSLKPLTRVGALNKGTLTVYTDLGAVAAKIKLLLPSLLTKLQKRGIEVTAIRVRVQVKSEPQPKAKIQRKISAKGASRLASLAKELEGSALGEVLERLSRRT